MPVDARRLEGMPVLVGLSSDELEEFATHLSPRSVEAGQPIIKEGDSPDHPIYILLKGYVDVTKRGLDGKARIISSLSAPSVFGEVEMLAKKPAIAGIAAGSGVELAVLSRGQFDELCNQNRLCILKFIKNLARVLSFRLASTDERLAAHFHGADLAQVQGALYASTNGHLQGGSKT